MKKVLVAAILMATTTCFAGVNPTKLAKEIRNKAIINLTSIELDNEGRDFVSVKFRIEENEIRILNMNGSSDELKARVKAKLETMRISSEYEEGRKYIYRFTFEKE